MTRQFGRSCSLVIGQQGGAALDLSSMHIRFTVSQATIQTPASADIRVYNLSPDTAKRIQKEFTRVELRAGYGAIPGVIFTGDTIQIRRGRESATDTYLDILACDTDKIHSQSTVSKSFTAGASQKDILYSLAGSAGLTIGSAPEIAEYKLPRGVVLHGMTADHLRTWGATNGADWFASGGVLDVVPRDGTAPGEAIVLSSETGLIGMPEQTIDGIQCRALLNPAIKPGRQVKIDNASIQEAKFATAYQAQIENTKFAPRDSDGAYKVYWVEHQGDTRGTTWYTDLICVSVDRSIPFSSKFINVVTKG